MALAKREQDQKCLYSLEIRTFYIKSTRSLFLKAQNVEYFFLKTKKIDRNVLLISKLLTSFKMCEAKKLIF